jgi:hypothetical protein
MMFMSLANTTPVPNQFFEHIPILTHAEIRVLLVVLRQTFGWKDRKTGQRIVKDKLSYDFILKKTGLYRTILSVTIQGLIDKKLLIVSDRKGNELSKAQDRKGKRFLFYQFQPVRNSDMTCSQSRIEPVRNSEHTQRNTNKKKLLQKENIEKLKALQLPLMEKLKMNID